MFYSNFMKVFMYLLEILLNESKEQLKEVSFQSDEANTDRPLKEFIKNKIESELRMVPQEYYRLNLAYYDGHKRTIPFSTFKNVRIDKVYLPDEITEDIKNIIKEQKPNSVYTNPDLLLEINYGKRIGYETIELKSTKTDAIPGSSVQQVNPNEWAIFVKHSTRDSEVRTGQYLHAINSKFQFPDRSPRPQVSFSELKKWNEENRVIENNILSYYNDQNEKLKYKVLNDWQGVLVDRWIDMLFNATSVKPNEPWFNNNMRKFIIEFLDNYEKLTDEEKEEFKSNIKALIM